MESMKAFGRVGSNEGEVEKGKVLFGGACFTIGLLLFPEEFANANC